MDVFNSSLYYVTPGSSKIFRVDKFGRGVPDVSMSGGLTHPYGLKIVQQQRYLPYVARMYKTTTPDEIS